MNILALTVAILALVIYIPTTVQVWRGKMVLNGATFVMWGLLDAIAAASIYVKGGNWLLPAAYVLGCALVIAAIIKVKSFTWTKVETFTAFLVFISMMVWWISGPVMATVASTAGVVIAGLPQTWDIWRKPEQSTLWVWAAYAFVNILSTIAGKDWSISERLYPGSCAVLTIVMVALTLRKFGKNSATT